MGINRGTARLLLAEHARLPFRGSVLELGRQKVTLSEVQLRKWACEAGVVLRSRRTKSQPDRTRGIGVPQEAMDDVFFFNLLGFDDVVSCDASAYEEADLVFDLNQPVPQELHGRFDVVFNGGTMEHVFNVPCVLANIHAMLKTGGRAIHIAPSSSLVDHGFYSFSPTLFFDYYQANRYDIAAIHIFECFDWLTEWAVYKYSPGCLDDRWDKIATCKKVGVFCVAQRVADSTSDVVPAQGYYRRRWSVGSDSEETSWGSPLKRFVRNRLPAVGEVLYSVRALSRQLAFRHRRFMPPLVGRF